MFGDHMLSKEEDARVQDFAGHQAWGNLPFSVMHTIVMNFLRCKKLRQISGKFLVPVWGPKRGKAPDRTWELVSGMPEVFKVALRSEQQRYEEEALAHGGEGLRHVLRRLRVFGLPGAVAPGDGCHTGVVHYILFVHVDFRSLSELSLWAAILVGFFGLFRKDNLTAGKEEAFNSRAALVRDDVLLTEDGRFRALCCARLQR
ncbi:hypothetical protein CYMTET_40513 [Cymbomonas tetramitiformis]|uniref:Uncharacterized protein n=1 Tax=Cymbomonas tetramitiformis TaxID=36881 RepID=A0AAE0F363_9CHLO|nr:hypothetical protein CYMTET_40513 [Cymbomonas tetramitiformis]